MFDRWKGTPGTVPLFPAIPASVASLNEKLHDEMKYEIPSIKSSGNYGDVKFYPNWVDLSIYIFQAGPATAPRDTLLK